MLDINREQVGGARVEYVLADVFEWEPDDQFDFVFFANWLSHVPPTRFDQFWNLVERALAPGGKVFFIDEAEDAWRHEESLNEEFINDEVMPLVRRRLRNGRAFRVVKVFWKPDELAERLRSIGWKVKMGNTGAFYWGEGSRSGRSAATGAGTTQSK